MHCADPGCLEGLPVREARSFSTPTALSTSSPSSASAAATVRRLSVRCTALNPEDNRVYQKCTPDA